MCKVENGGAEALAVPIPDAEGRYRAFEGRRVILGIRPEHVTQADSAPAGPGGPFVFESTVYFVEPTGPDTLVFMDIGATRAVARVKPDTVIREGERMRFAMG